VITLYHSPMACSLASKLALAESGLPHTVELVRTSRGEHQTAAYLAINPAGKVPALSVDGTILTESTAILPLIADLAPDAGRLPTDRLARAQAQSLLSFISNSVHAAFTPCMFPARLAGDANPEAVRAAALERLSHALLLLENRLGDREHLLDAFSVCDLYLTVFLGWRASPAVAGKLLDTPRLDALQGRVLRRPRIGPAFVEDIALRQEG
jgi:glutathione S-transferase